MKTVEHLRVAHLLDPYCHIYSNGAGTLLFLVRWRCLKVIDYFSSLNPKYITFFSIKLLLIRHRHRHRHLDRRDL